MASRRDATGSIVGLQVFFAGVGLLGLTFKLAYDQFNVPHAEALHLVKDQAFDARVTGGGLADVLIRLGVLFVMAVVGSMVANKGIGLYSGSLHPVEKHLVPGASPEVPLQETDAPPTA
ncbi:hypothetical protein EON82_15975 [bacterium]|nr:MAG: hypothetical protein EON82_15975 [bacterium]